MTDFYREVLERAFKARRGTPCTDQDVACIEREVQLLEERGATFEEAVNYVKCLEEYDPTLDEATALARMQAIRKTCEERTGKKWYS